MLDQITAREWILLAVIVLAYQPARYVVLHILASPSRRDITLPKEDLSWRTAAQLARSLAMLAVLLGLAIFIYTPSAERLARSPQLFPAIMFAIGAWSLVTVQRGFATGRIQPFAKGFNDTYERETQPKRFWASLAWNFVLGGFLLLIAYQGFADAPRRALEDACRDKEDRLSPDERISACTTLIADPDSSFDDVELYLSNRGIAYYDRGDLRRALADYDEAIRREADDSSTLYNRALVHWQQGNLRQATADFSAAIRIDPKDPDPYAQRGIIFLDTGRFDAAIADFSQANRLKPDDQWPLANRGIAYAWKRDNAQARRDFAAVRVIDPTNVVLMRGEALMAMQSGEYELAAQHLTAALNRDPSDEWSLRMRANAYEHLGEEEKRLTDLDRLWELRTTKDRQ